MYISEVTQLYMRSWIAKGSGVNNGHVKTSNDAVPNNSADNSPKSDCMPVFFPDQLNVGTLTETVVENMVSLSIFVYMYHYTAKIHYEFQNAAHMQTTLTWLDMA